MLYDKVGNIGLQITEGPHKDTQELRIHAFHWFNRFLKGEDPLIETAAVKLFEPEQLKVFDALPDDELNTTIDEPFVETAELPDSSEVNCTNCSVAGYRKKLLQKCFRGWPSTTLGLPPGPKLDAPQFAAEHDGVHVSAYKFSPEQHIDLTLFVLRAADREPDSLKLCVLNVLDEQGWIEFLAMVRPAFGEHFENEVKTDDADSDWKTLAGMLKATPWGMAYLCPRGIGPTAWDQSERKQTHHRRRFMLLGQTLDGMRVWDVRRGVQALRAIDGYDNVDIWCQAEREMSGIALYAALFSFGHVKRLDLYDLPASHQEGPMFLNVLRLTDIPMTVAMATHRTRVVIYDNDADRWKWSKDVVAGQTNLKGGLQIRKRPPTE